MTSINNYSEFTVKQRKKCSWVQFLTGRRPEEFFSWGSRHHCPMEVGAYDRWRLYNSSVPADIVRGQ